jgi:hypothetical protein
VLAEHDAIAAASSAADLLLPGVDVINYSVIMLGAVCSPDRSSTAQAFCDSAQPCPCRYTFVHKQVDGLQRSLKSTILLLVHVKCCTVR